MGIPRKRALFVSDGPDGTTSGSDILEGHYDRPPEEGYSDVHSTGRPHDVHVAEELCSPSEHLEKAVVRLQQDITDYRAELELNRTQTPAVSTRPPKRSGFTSTSVPRFSGKSNWEQYRQLFEAIVRLNGWDSVMAALQLLSHLDGCPQRSSTDPGVSADVAGIFGEFIVGPLQFSRAVGRIQALVSEGVWASG